jgi:hypothetical protein
VGDPVEHLLGHQHRPECRHPGDGLTEGTS